MSVKKVTYNLGIQAGYKFGIVKMGEHNYDPLAYYHKDNFPDVELTRPGIDSDLDLLHKKCLLTVNGFVYPTEYFDSKLFIPNATVNLLKSKSNHVGILSFNKLSSNLKKHKVTVDMISHDVATPLYEKAIISFPAPVDGVFFVLAGYPIFEQPEFFYRVSDRSFALRLDRLNYMEKLYELSKYRNIFEELGVEVSPNNVNVIDASIVRSDVIVSKFLSLFNTFLVETPGHSISTKNIYLEHSNVPGNFRTELSPTLPVIGGYGKFIEYLVTKNNDSKFTVNTTDAYLNNHLFSKLSTSQIDIYNSAREVGNTYKLSSAFFLEVSCTEM